MRGKKMKLPINKIILGDSREVLQEFPDACIDLIVTSPPYADCRKKLTVVFIQINM